MEMGAKTGDIRYDWGRTLTELFDERFAVTVTDWAHRNGTKFRSQNYGIPPASISSSAFTDISDGEGAQWKVVRAARWASSANHIYGKNITSSETWTWLHSPVFRATPLDMKAEADIHFLQGINQLIGHGWAYTPPQVEYPGWRFYAAGIYDEKNPWWIVMQDLSAYLQRMSWLMRQGRQTNDVALYLPNADAYAHFSAGKVHLIDVEKELVGDKIMPQIFDAGYNLDFFDDEMLKTIGRVEKSNLNLGAGKYRVVVLPNIERIPLESLKKLDEFVKNGGILVATRRAPSLAPGFKTPASEQKQVREIAKRLFEDANAPAKLVKNEDELGAVLKSLLQPDVALSPAVKDFGFVHRSTEDAEIYFVANTTNTRQNVQITFRMNNSQPELWNPMNGKVSAVASSVKNGGTTIPLNFEPYESRVVIFSKRKLQVPAQMPVTTSTIAFDKNWRISFGQTNQAKMVNQLKSWTDNQQTLYYSGAATYEKELIVPANNIKQGFTARIDFGEAISLPVQILKNGMQTWLDAPVKESAVVYVNDRRAGSVWCPPYNLEITPYLRKGANKIRVVVGNTALNYMSGRKLPDYKLLNTRYGERFQPQDMEKIQPLESGLTGNVRILFEKI